MNTALFRKELRAQLPFFIFVAVVQLLNVLDGLVDEFLDMSEPWAIFSSVGASDADGVVTALLAFALGTGLLVRDFDDRTIEFLDALPVSRTAIFSTKMLVGYSALAAYPIFQALWAAARFGFASTSLYDDVPWAWIIQGTALDLLRSAVFLAFGVAVSFLRPFSWILLGLAFWSYELAHHHFPDAELLDPLAVTRRHFDGATWRTPWPRVGAQLALGGALCALAYLAFLRSGSGVRTGVLGRLGDRSKRFWGAAVVVVTIGLGISVTAYVARDEERPKEGSVTFAAPPSAEASTERYGMVYPVAMTARARGLLARADEVHQGVVEVLSTTVALSLAVDATGAGAHDAGNALGSKIRIDLANLSDPQTLAAVLAHETAHAYAASLSRGRVQEQANSARFFNEGLATYVEYARFAPGERPSLRLIAAALRARKLVDIEDLVDDRRLRRKYSEDVVYPLGEAFIEALVSHHGPSAPSAVLRAMGREEARKDLTGMALWRDTFQTAGYDFDAVVSTFYRQLDRWARAEAKRLRALPRLIGAVETDDEDLVIILDDDDELPEGFALACRIRPREDSPESKYVFPTTRYSDGCAFDRRDVLGPSFWFQLGLNEVGTHRTLWEPWVEIQGLPE